MVTRELTRWSVHRPVVATRGHSVLLLLLLTAVRREVLLRLVLMAGTWGVGSSSATHVVRMVVVMVGHGIARSKV